MREKFYLATFSLEQRRLVLRRSSESHQRFLLLWISIRYIGIIKLINKNDKNIEIMTFKFF